ncbi:MAG: hypothetical protein HY393_01385 [Candidatus Diapherotrites archaeon]|nr:hypothetical protein [Candidatus Diapherotrites archaeon]
MSRAGTWPALFLTVLFLSSFATPVLAVLSEGSMKVYAVTTEGEALEAELILQIKPGSGNIWSAITPLVGTTTQNAERVAIKVASNYVDTGGYDYFFTIKSNASVVEGPSAGAAMTALAVTMLQDKPFPKNVALTGTISDDGTVGAVGGVFEKSKEAAGKGIKLFMIPKGEAKQVVKLPEGVKTVLLPEYALQTWGMKVVEVHDLDQVLELAFKDIGQIDINEAVEPELETYIPEKVEVKPKAQALGELNKRLLASATQIVNEARNSLSTTLLEDPGLINVLLDSLNSSEKTLQEAELLTANNFYYSAGNSIFLAKVNAYLVKDLSENPSLLNQGSTFFSLNISSLNKEIQSFKRVLDNAVPLEGIEWYIAAQQRLTWAELNVKKLTENQVIQVDIEGDPNAAYNEIIGRLREYEFARAWFEAAKDFYEIGLQTSANQVKPDESFKDYFGDFQVNVENGLTVISQEDSEDIVRRLDASKLEQAHKWHLAASMDAASALGLVNGTIAGQDKDYETLLMELSEKIQTLSQDMSASRHEFAWANLYLDHARYFLKSAEFYHSKNKGTSASGFLHNGLLLAYLAENTFRVTEDIYAYYDSIDAYKKTPLTVNGTQPFTNGVQIKVEPIPGFTLQQMLFMGLLGLILLLIVLVVGLTLIQRKSAASARPASGGDKSSSSKSARLVELDTLEARVFANRVAVRHLEEQQAQGLLSKEEFENAKSRMEMESREYRKRMRAVQAGRSHAPAANEAKPKPVGTGESKPKWKAKGTAKKKILPKPGA